MNNKKRIDVEKVCEQCSSVIYHHSKIHKVYDKQPIYDLKLIERNNNV